MEKKQLTKGQKVFGVILGFVIMFWFIGSLGSNKKQPSVSSNQPVASKTVVVEEAIIITADDLYLAYKDNEVNADNTYKGKLVKISGIIDSIGKDILDKPYVTIKTENSFSNVQCFVADDALDSVATLKSDQSIVMEGRVDGYLMNVSVKNCRISQ